MRKRRKFKKKSSLKKFLIIFFVLVILGGIGLVYELYSRVYQTNIMFSNNSSEKYIHIPTNSDFSKVVNILVEHGLLININSFEWLAKQKNIIQI